MPFQGSAQSMAKSDPLKGLLMPNKLGMLPWQKPWKVLGRTGVAKKGHLFGIDARLLQEVPDDGVDDLLCLIHGRLHRGVHGAGLHGEDACTKPFWMQSMASRHEVLQAGAISCVHWSCVATDGMN